MLVFCGEEGMSFGRVVYVSGYQVCVCVCMCVYVCMRACMRACVCSHAVVMFFKLSTGKSTLSKITFSTFNCY